VFDLPWIAQACGLPQALEAVDPEQVIDLPLDKFPPPSPELVRQIMGDPLPPIVLTDEQRRRIIPGSEFVKWMEKQDRQAERERKEMERWLKKVRKEKFDPDGYSQGSLL
jgi:hypothetical protein